MVKGKMGGQGPTVPAPSPHLTPNPGKGKNDEAGLAARLVVFGERVDLA